MTPADILCLHEASIRVSRASLRNSPRFSLMFITVLGGWFYFIDEDGIKVEVLIPLPQVSRVLSGRGGIRVEAVWLSRLQITWRHKHGTWCLGETIPLMPVTASMSLGKNVLNIVFQSLEFGQRTWEHIFLEQEARTQVAASGGRRGGGGGGEKEGEREKGRGGRRGGGRSTLWREWWHHQHRLSTFLVFGPWWLALNTLYHLILAADLGGSRARVLAAHLQPRRGFVWIHFWGGPTSQAPKWGCEDSEGWHLDSGAEELALPGKSINNKNICFWNVSLIW